MHPFIYLKTVFCILLLFFCWQIGWCKMSFCLARCTQNDLSTYLVDELLLIHSGGFDEFYYCSILQVFWKNSSNERIILYIIITVQMLWFDEFFRIIRDVQTNSKFRQKYHSVLSSLVNYVQVFLAHSSSHKVVHFSDLFRCTISTFTKFW